MILTAFREKTGLQRRLLAWYRKEKRPLPWRKTRDPYKIWVSEVMLQQTQVATVIPYYKRWLKAFPSLRQLAKAPAARVLKLWEGLGYYRRARMLHQAARYIVERLSGKMPATAEALRKLPGIGRYSSGAIASIAFEERVPVLDGNVIRVLTRLFAMSQSIDRPLTLNALWEIAGALLPESPVGDFNQAVMELGATVCFPQNPDCGKCPLRGLCKAHKRGKEMDFPVRTRKDKHEKLTMYALVPENHRKEVFLQKQPPGHWWTGLWTFPFCGARSQLFRLAGSGKGLVPLGTIRHGVTRFRIELRVFHKFFRGKPLLPVKGRWVGIEHLKRAALPAPHRKIADLLSRLK